MCVNNILLCLHYITTFAFAIGGAAIVAAGGIWVQKTNDFNHDGGIDLDVAITAPVFILIAIGALLCLLALLGCLGACCESRCLLLTYSVVLGTIFIVQVVVLVVLIMNGKDPIDVIRKALYKELDNCATGSSAAGFFQTIQKQFSCCGVDGVQDYLSHGSCKEVALTCSSNILTGCATALSDLINTYMKYVAGVGIGVAVVEVLGTIAGCTVASWVSRNY